MRHFAPRRTQPMRPDSYRRIARLLRRVADRIDTCSERSDPTEKRVLTQILHTLARDARQWSARHRATIDGTLTLPKE
jgi:hypothetical protein